MAKKTFNGFFSVASYKLLQKSSKMDFAIN